MAAAIAIASSVAEAAVAFAYRIADGASDVLLSRASITVPVPTVLVLAIVIFGLYYRWLCAPPRLYGANGALNRRLLSSKYDLGSVLSSYRPPVYMPHGHVQNAFTFFYKHFVAIPYRREILTVSALQVERLPGIVALDWAVPSTPPAYTDRTPTILLLHGLAGGSAENYIRVTANRLMERCGYRCVVMNARGCGGTKLVTPQAFSASYTDDLRQVVWHLQRRLPNAPICAIGFSLGANILLKYVGEEGADCPLTAAIVVSTPFDLVLNSRSLDRTAFRHYAYHRVLGNSLVRLMDQHPQYIATATASAGSPAAAAASHSISDDVSSFADGIEASLLAMPESAPSTAAGMSPAAVSVSPPQAVRRGKRGGPNGSHATASRTNSGGSSSGGGCGGCCGRVCSVICFIGLLFRWSLGVIIFAYRFTRIACGAVHDFLANCVFAPSIPCGSTSGAVGALGRREGFAADADSAPELTVRTFDERITRRAFGFRSVDDYYRYSSTVSSICTVGGGPGVGTGASMDAAARAHTTHVLAVNSLDDPIVSAESLPYDECGVYNRDHTMLVTTRTGSHSMMFFENSERTGRTFAFPPDSWLARVACAYFPAAISELAPTPATASPPAAMSHPPPLSPHESASVAYGDVKRCELPSASAGASTAAVTAADPDSDAAAAPNDECVTDEMLRDISRLNQLLAHPNH